MQAAMNQQPALPTHPKVTLAAAQWHQHQQQASAAAATIAQQNVQAQQQQQLQQQTTQATAAAMVAAQHPGQVLSAVQRLEHDAEMARQQAATNAVHLGNAAAAVGTTPINQFFAGQAAKQQQAQQAAEAEGAAVAAHTDENMSMHRGA